jgi:hypothetical protein
MQHYATDSKLHSLMENNFGENTAYVSLFSTQMLGYGVQYAGTIGFMGYNPFDYKGSPKKALIASEKSLFFLLTLF